MGIDVTAVGRMLGPVEKTYTWKDVILYALGVGAGFGDLFYCHEKNLKVIPSFAAARVIDFFFRAAESAGCNPGGILHGEHMVALQRPLPTEARIVTSGAITKIIDKGREKGARIQASFDTCLADGTPLFTNHLTVVARHDGGFGGDRGEPVHTPSVPQGPPDDTSDALPSPDQPLLYRMSGDLFPLHAEPEFARRSGFERPIMHGLCTFGFACRALIAALIPGEPERVKQMGCRFSRPLFPGDPIRTRLWRKAPGKAVWETVNQKTGETVLSAGFFEWE